MNKTIRIIRLNFSFELKENFDENFLNFFMNYDNVTTFKETKCRKLSLEVSTHFKSIYDLPWNHYSKIKLIGQLY